MSLLNFASALHQIKTCSSQHELLASDIKLIQTVLTESQTAEDIDVFTHTTNDARTLLTVLQYLSRDGAVEEMWTSNRSEKEIAGQKGIGGR